MGLLLSIFFTLTSAHAQFVQTHDGQLTLNEQAYHFLGTNFWYGMNLGSTGKSGDRQRLRQELNHLQRLGVLNLRVLALSEGPENAPWRLQPANQQSPGTLSENLLQGLDFLLNEMSKRQMKAVVVLNNFWPWSGGMAQYQSWTTKTTIPYPPPEPGGRWDLFQNYTSSFYANTQANMLFQKAIATIITRKNTITKNTYLNDPTIMSWELANEPRGGMHPQELNVWIHETAQFIKSLDPHHLVTVGSEGLTPYPSTNNDFYKNHASKYIDYTTIHIWPTNWNWFDPQRADATIQIALQKTKAYLLQHLSMSEKMERPMVLEEFGFPRDKESYSPTSSTYYRNLFYEEIFKFVYQLAEKRKSMAGINFWAWSGEGRPLENKMYWAAGDSFTGDPPHERQGWYSVYSTDTKTHNILRAYTKLISELQ